MKLKSAMNLRSQFYCCLFVIWVSGLVTAQERPNFVWLISEDNSKHFLKLFDENGAETPAISSLAKHGLVFEHAFSNAPVCSVARTTLITGCFAPRIGTQYHRRAKLVPMPDGVKMFPAYLRQAGYYTTNRQKKDYNAIEGGDVWDASSKQASWRNRSKGQPFFHKQSFTVSHEGSLHFSQQVMDSRTTKTDPNSVFVAPHHPDTETFRYTYAQYHDRIRAVDRAIGKVVSDLKADGVLEDTFIFYFGDHGGVLPGSKGYAYETGLHIPLVVRVPDRWKHLVDADLNTRIDGFVSFVDFGPTLLKLAGVPNPAEQLVDGKPFLGNGVSMQEVNSRDSTVGYADRFDEKYDLVRTLRVGKWKYIRNYQPFYFDGLQNNYRYKMLAYQQWRSRFKNGQLNDVQSKFFKTKPVEELYNVELDPYETRNLVGEPDANEMLQRLRGRLQKHLKQSCDLGFYPESYLIQNAFENPVQFGQTHRMEIAKLIDTADLALLEYRQARDLLMKATHSENPWVRNWGLSGFSSFAQADPEWIRRSQQIAKNDPELLNRVRAAEYLGLVGQANVQATILDSLLKVQSGTEASLMLNSAVLLTDGPSSLSFDWREEHFPLHFDDSSDVKRRKDYLMRDPQEN